MYLPANDALGKLLLRVTLALLMLPHGVAKIIGGVAGIAGRLAELGVPGFFAYAVLLGQLVAPVLVLIGWYARAGALLIAITMVVAIAMVHSMDLYRFGGTGGWALELQYCYLFGALSVMLLGPGRYAINDR